MSEFKIAGNFTIQQWNELKITLNPEKQKNWDLAFHFFEERITTRYLNPIHTILKMNDNLGEGFAVVSLQCSLIETIECFINGWKFSVEPYGWFKNEIKKGKNDKSIKKNEEIFISFFENRQPLNGLGVDGLDFYRSVRCGLLHETQTKNEWKILVDGERNSIDKKVIYRNNFQKDIEKVIDNYKNAIVQGIELNKNTTMQELRENFIAKFNHICKVSIEK